MTDRKPADHGGVPMCSHLVCPKFSTAEKNAELARNEKRTIGTCSELGDAIPTDVCIPAVRDMASKLAEHELLFAVAVKRDDFLQKLLFDLGRELPPGTPRTVDGIVGAVQGMALKLDAHEDASTPAFDEIAKLCGCPEWGYPGQVVRDVELVIERLRVAEAVRDDARAASQRYLDEKRESEEYWRAEHERILAAMRGQADHYEELRSNRDQLTVRRDELLATIARLSNTVPFPEEFATWESQRAKLIAEVGSLRSQVKFLSDDQLRLIGERDNTKANYDSVARNLVAEQNENEQLARGVLPERLIRLLSDSQYSLAVIENLRAALTRIVGAVPGQDGVVPEVVDGPWVDAVVDDIANVAKERNEAYLQRASAEQAFKERSAELVDLRDRIRVAEATRDDARAASQRDLELRREAAEVSATQKAINDTEVISLRAKVASLEERFIGESEHDQYDRATGDLGSPLYETKQCACSPKYRELAPGVHAMYCALAGLPLLPLLPLEVIR